MSAPRTHTSSVASAMSLFEHFRDGTPRTRAELMATTGLARSTIAARLDNLIDLDLIAPHEDGASTGGRPPSRFALNRAGRMLLCADLGASHMTIALTDLTGAVLHEHTESLRIAEGPELTLARVTEVADDLLAEAGRGRDALAAIGVGVPGPVEFSTGRPSNPPIMPGWDGYDIPGRLQEYAPIPVLVDNDVNIMALGERTTHFSEVDDLVFIKVGTGLGGSIISGGDLQRGSRGIAGDLGHIRIARAAGMLCSCGNTGCLGAVASGRSLSKGMRARGFDIPDHNEIVRLVRQGDLEAIAVIRQAGRDIGEMLIACICVINPSVIVLGGSIAQAGEYLLAGVREVVYSQSAPLATHDLQIVQSRAGARAGIIGAAALAVERLLTPEGAESMVPA